MPREHRIARVKAMLRRIRLASNRQKNLKVAVFLFEWEKLLDIAIDIVASTGLGISGVVLVSVRPRVRQDHLTRGLDIGKCVENIG